MGRFGAELTEAELDELLDREDDDSPRSIASSVYDPGMSARGSGADLLGVARQRSLSIIKMRKSSFVSQPVEENWSPVGTSIPETGSSNVTRVRGGKRVSISNMEAMVPTFGDDLLSPDSRPGR